jgi:hypothetical protein
MAAASIYKSSLLHDHEQHKKIQPEVKESRPQVGRACFPGKFPAIIEECALGSWSKSSSRFQLFSPISSTLHQYFI